MTQYIYFFKNRNNEILYVGKTNNLQRRLTQHFSLTNTSQKLYSGHLPDACYYSVCEIMYAEVQTKLEAEMYETYFINIYHPRYNCDKHFNERLSELIVLPDVNFIPLYIHSIQPLVFSKHKSFINFEKAKIIYNSNKDIENAILSRNLSTIYKQGIWEDVLIHKNISFSEIKRFLLDVSFFVRIDESNFDEDIYGNIKLQIPLYSEIIKYFSKELISLLFEIKLLRIEDDILYLTDAFFESSLFSSEKQIA